MTKLIVHDFNERLAFSQAMGDNEIAFTALYQDAWPTLIGTVRIDANSKYQQWGIDRLVLLPNGTQISIDEKVRDPERARYKDGTPYDDVLIEEYSVFHGERDSRNKPGWTLDVNKRCDYIAYALPLLQRCYLMPYELLRMAARTRLNDWKKLRDKKGFSCYPKFAQNNGYRTLNCAVSWANLQFAITEEMKRVFAKGTLELPIPTIRGQQAEFDWTADIEKL